MRVRKKPIVIEAFPVTEALSAAREGPWSAQPSWLIEAYENGEVLYVGNRIEIRTLEGWMKARAGDYIMRGIKGELYSCEGEIFRLTYEEAT